MTHKLGETYEIALNTYKPFPCGIVMHPTIDGCIQLRNEHKLTADAIARVDLQVHPLVLQLTSKKTAGLRARDQVQHLSRGERRTDRGRGGRSRSSAIRRHAIRR